MIKQTIFESFNASAYDDTTDPYAALVEGPKFTFGDNRASATEDEAEDTGLALDGDPTRSSIGLTPEREEAQRKAAEESEEELSSILPPEEGSDLESQADDFLAKYDPMAATDLSSYGQDALNHTVDIGDFDVVDDADGDEFSISGRRIVLPEEEPEDLPGEDQFGLDNPDAVLGDKEPGSGDGYNPPAPLSIEEPDPIMQDDRDLSTKLLSVDEIKKMLFSDQGGMPASSHAHIIKSIMGVAKAIEQMQQESAAQGVQIKPEVLANLQNTQMELQKLLVRHSIGRTTKAPDYSEFDEPAAL